MTLAFEEHGIGVPLVLLHAFPLSRGMWEPQIDELGLQYSPVPDLTGFGETPLAEAFPLLKKWLKALPAFLTGCR